MARQFVTLLGKDYADPSTYGVQAIGESAAIGIASVVTRDQKSHNYANNEDAAGIFDDGTVSIAMVADAHWGYVASQEAVLRFPDLFLKKQAALIGLDIRQVYLEAILDLCENELVGVGQSSGVNYGYRNRELMTDDSHSQFYSVVRVHGKYYFVGLGDCACAIIRNNSVTQITSQNIIYGGLGSMLSPRNYMRISPNHASLARSAQLRYDDPLVRKGVDVQELIVTPGDVIFMCSDGYPLMNQAICSTLPGIFSRGTVEQGVTDIMKEIVHNLRQYEDNIAICAMRVPWSQSTPCPEPTSQGGLNSGLRQLLLSLMSDDSLKRLLKNKN